MSARPPNERGPGGSPHDASSPYKRSRPQSPGAGVVASHPARQGVYPHSDYRSPYGLPGGSTYGTMYSNAYQHERPGASHIRRRPSMLNEYHHHGHNTASSVPATEGHAEAFRYEHAQIMPPRPAVEVVPGGPHGFKRPRMDLRQDLSQPLRIDTRDVEVKREPAYTPQVEAISPTLPPDEKGETSKTSKDDIVQQISKLDREIAMVETQISKLKKKQQQLEDQASRPPEEKSGTPEPPPVEPKNQSIPQIIYAENRKRAEAAHNLFDKLGPPVDLPIYNQPSDTAVYHENKRKYQMFKKRLILHFKKRHHAKRIRERYLSERYDQLMHTWMKKVERAENNVKRRAKEAKVREFYEKIFPELKKTREDRDRFSRSRSIGGYARSEAELEQIADGLHELEEEDKKMRAYAVIPPMILDAKQRHLQFINTNSLVEDPMAMYKEQKSSNIWTDIEHETFRERYLQQPKNFTYIASFLEKKSVADCVHYYYLTKKNEQYKQLLRKQSMKKRKVKGPAANIRQEDHKLIDPSEPPVPILTPQEKREMEERERQRQQQQMQQQQLVTSTASICSSTEAATPATMACPITMTTTSSDAGTDSSSSQPVAAKQTCDGNGCPPSSGADKPPTSTLSGCEGEGDHCPEGTHLCSVCKHPLEHPSMSRPLSKNNCELYGIGEADYTPDMRVCSSCRCRSVRRRYTQCPVPTCKTPKKKKVPTATLR